MSKTEINNEFVLLRKSVRQARICVINKLVREAKKLSIDRGNEKQFEKNRNRAEKLLREINALKPIKDDEISKYGMTNLKNLNNILQDPSSNDETRIKCKVVRYKILTARLTEFMEKFPDYEKHLFTSKKKKTLPQKKLVKDTVDDSVKISNTNEPKDQKNDKKEEKKSLRQSERSKSIECKAQPIQKEKCNIVCSDSSKKESILIRNGLEEDAVEEQKSSTSENTKNLPKSEFKDTNRVINKEATVKRFAEILHDDKTDKEVVVEVDTQRDQELESSDKTIKVERQVDDFFMNPGSNVPYSTMAVTSGKNDTNTMHSENSKTKSPRNKFSNDMQSERLNDGKRGKQNGDETERNRPKFAGQAPCSDKRFKDFDSSKKSSSKNVLIESNVDDNSQKGLHPSWAAKKKQQEMINLSFQGKKLRFEDD